MATAQPLQEQPETVERDRKPIKTDRHSDSQSSRHSSRRSSRHSHSSVTSLLARQRAKLEAAKTLVEFANRESEMDKEKARLETERIRQSIKYESDLRYLHKQRDAAVEQAKYDALCEELSGTIDSVSEARLEPEIPTDDPKVRTEKYVADHTSLLRFQPQPPQFENDPRPSFYHPCPQVAPYAAEFQPVSIPLNPKCAPFVPQKEVYTDFTNFLLKKDLLLQRLTNFNDKPECFAVWKSSFQSVVNELGVTPCDEFDLLLKWLGPESKKHAVSLRTASTSNPAVGLRRLWERLHERYGCPEMVESSLKYKLTNFPKLGNKDNAKLYELSDILTEIESAMEDPTYASLLSYFNTSSGVLPIATKLPYHLQGKWTARATKYKKDNSVSFPPFSAFATFVREMSSMMNDPGLNCQPEDNARAKVHNRFETYKSSASKSSISAKKTQVDNVPSPVPRCPIHQSRHSLNQCRAFRYKSLAERKRLIYDHRICFRCCETDSHMFKDCTASIKCGVCGSEKHPSALHPRVTASNTTSKQEDSGTVSPSNAQPQSQHGGENEGAVGIVNKCTRICGNNFSERSCAKTMLVNVYPEGKPEQSHTVYAILDDQSNRTLCQSKLFELMDIPQVTTEHYMLKSCNGSVPIEGRQADGLVVSSFDGSFSIALPRVLECDQIPNSRDEIPTPDITVFHSHLMDIPIPPLEPHAEILLLIGRDIPEVHHVLEQRTGPMNSPFAQKLHLGWVVVGNMCLGSTHQTEIVKVFKTHVLEDGRPTIFPPCHNKFQITEDDIGSTVFQQHKDDNKLGLSVEDRLFLELMDKEFTRDQHGKWIAPLPFCQPRPRLPNNRSHALRRAHILDASLKKNTLKREHLVTFMEGILNNGHAEIAPPLSKNEECWYLPLFGVYHPKKPNKIRGVFDSSAKFEGISLNQVLMKGPDLANSLLGVLLRFRKDRVAVGCDVEQMFYCFSVREDHRNYLRFIWYENNDPTERLIEYRMCKHVLGNSPSPAVATFGLCRTVQQVENEFGSDVREFVDKNFYVDDGLVSLATVAEAISLLNRTQEAMCTAGIRLHKFVSNNEDVLNALRSDDLSSDLKTLEFGIDALPTQRSLGLCWELETDSFTFNISTNSKPYTRRGVLSTINSLYDPLGFLSPITIQGKILLRDMVSETIHWDQPLPTEFKDAWERWELSLQDLNKFTVPRQYVSDTDSPIELHIFSDASEKVISAVAFFKFVDTQRRSQYSFVFGKSKVSPKHGHTIPRLELCAAVLAVEIAEVLADELSLSSENMTFHTDSKVVLGYLSNETRRFYVYVANRVSRIRKFSTPNQWLYISTEENPADVGTRYIAPSLLEESMWIRGPKTSATLNLTVDYPLIAPDSDAEIRPEVVIVAKTCAQGNSNVRTFTERFQKFSSWRNLLSAIAFLIRAAKQLKFKNRDDADTTQCKNEFSIACYNTAEIFILKEVQREKYGGDLSKCPKELSPFLDENALVRVGGRLGKTELPVTEKHPILVPGRCHIATLLTRHFHEKVYHQGRHFTEGAIRAAGFWIVGGKRLVSYVIHHCVKCRKLRGRTCQQKMADLPPDRLTPSPPFTYVGVDVFGPWNVVSRKTRGGSATSKRWAVLFSCLTTRAIHIELIEEMSSSSFINAVRRLQSIRGKVKEFRSDRGTNFVGATDELHIDAIKVEDGPINKLLFDSGTVWRFNPPHSSHMGGSWERMIGVVRKVLDSILLDEKGKDLTHEVLSTFMCEVMAVVNSRPIVPVSSDSDSPLILTPSVLLTQKTGSSVDTFTPPGTKDMYRSQWKHVQVLSDRFWRRWRVEYLPTLQQRRKWYQEQPNINEGDVVLLQDNSLPRNDWSIGIINRVFPSDDGLVRKVEVQVVRDGTKSNFIRPVVDIVKLMDIP